MRVYITGPMTGIEDFNYPAFNTAADQLRAVGHEPVNPVDTDNENTTGEPQPWEWYLRRDIRMITYVDGIARLPGWSQSKGASLECVVATALGLDIRDLDMWLS